MNIKSVADIVEENGKTVRQNNLEKKHNIPIGSIVEVYVNVEHQNATYPDVQVNLSGKCNLIVVGHTRDCDGTPLYTVADIPYAPLGMKYSKQREELLVESFAHCVKVGYAEEDLKDTGNKVSTVFTNAREYINVMLGM
jgi:hypothetical protein